MTSRPHTGDREAAGVCPAPVFNSAQATPPDGALLIALRAVSDPRAWQPSGGAETPPGLSPVIFDGAGVVKAVGAHVRERHLGDRVFGRFFAPEGAPYLSYVTAPQWSSLAPMPLTIDFHCAAGAIAPAVAAMELVAAVAPRPGERTLVVAPAGLMTIVLLQLLRRRGAHVIVGSQQERAHARLWRSLGARDCVDHPGDLNSAVRAQVRGGVDVVIDAVGDSAAVSARAALLRGGGRIATLQGTVSGAVHTRAQISAARVIPRPSSSQLAELARLVDETGLRIALPAGGAERRHA